MMTHQKMGAFIEGADIETLVMGQGHQNGTVLA
jgi:hypothetical protein